MSCCCCSWFLCHFLTQCMCVTVQQMVHDQILEVRTTSLVQMTHS